VILPKNVERLHMDFAIKINDGHRGPRCALTTRQHHNPSSDFKHVEYFGDACFLD